MARNRTPVLAAGMIVVAIALGLGLWAVARGGYQVKLVMDSAAQLIKGSPVWAEGIQVGDVADLDTRNGKAIVTIALDDAHAPLHEGTGARVQWKSVLGERGIALTPGPESNPAIQDGALFEPGRSYQIEVDQVLSALDPPTREKLRGMFQNLATTTKGSEIDLAATLKSAGPSVQALGEILKAVGNDGPAIQHLVDELSAMLKPVVARQNQLSTTVNSLTSFTGNVARQQAALQDTLADLPATLRETDTTLRKVPTAVDATVPLLDDFRPTMKRLPGLSRDLSPLMSDLRPAARDLRPTLEAATELLEKTPRFLDTSAGTLPDVGKLATRLTPALGFIRPYTPELAGWLTNWNSQYSTYDAQGHMWYGGLAPGPAGYNESLALLPPVQKNPRPAPGEVVGQAWDADGDGMR